MKFKEYDMIRTTKNCKEGVCKGEIGAIIMVFEEPQEAYEVEFLDERGFPKVQCTLHPEEMELVDCLD